MAELLSYSVLGLGMLLVGAIDSLSSSPSLSSFRSISILSLSSLSLLNSTICLFQNFTAHDDLGFSLHLSSFAVSSLFLLYSLAARLQLPSQILELLAFFALAGEFLVFKFQFKDLSGVENRYYDLLLIPIAICASATLVSASSPESSFPRLIRGLGLTLQGTWLLQMGFSFFTTAISDGCFLRTRGRGNYTVQCKGHPEFHRGRAVATLQFNGHVALVALAFLGFFAAGGGNGKYEEAAKEMRGVGEYSRFTLDSDEEDGVEIVRTSTTTTVANGSGGPGGFAL